MFHRNNKQQPQHSNGVFQTTPTTTTTTTTTMGSSIEPSMSTSSDDSSCTIMSSTDISHPSAKSSSLSNGTNNHHLLFQLSREQQQQEQRPSSSSSLTKPTTKYEKRSHHHNTNGIFVSYRSLAIPSFILLCVFVWTLSSFQQHQQSPDHHFFRRHSFRSGTNSGTSSSSLYHLRTTHSHTAIVAVATTTTATNTGTTINANTDDFECRWYLAESAIPHSGLGIFTGIPLHKNDMIGYPDICIFVSDGPSQWTHLRSHSFGRGSFFGQYEGKTNRAACEGLITTVNTVPDAMVNMEMVSPVLPTNAGLHRAVSPGAGASTHHYGIHGKAISTITAGSEITINYGDWDFSEKEQSGSGTNVYEHKPIRDVTWLQQYGWCMDYIDIAISTIPHAGRGAFARTGLSIGTVVAPAPLQVFEDRAIFQSKTKGSEKKSEQLYVNYCLQPAETKMLLYPYGQGVNLINHSLKQPNVEFRWSLNQMHHGEYLDLSTNEEFWKMITPGSIVLEVVALRDIEPGEELLLNYGSAWDDAWNAHVAHWKPAVDATQYVYSSEMDETLPVRTIREQVDDPYPSNLITMCLTNDFEREEHNHLVWAEPSEYQYAWSERMVFCHVLERTYDATIRDDLYTVSLLFNSNSRTDFTFNATIPLDDLYIDMKVPRRAIRFIEQPYQDDEHLPNAFRHPIELPIHLVPEIWK